MSFFLSLFSCLHVRCRLFAFHLIEFEHELIFMQTGPCVPSSKLLYASCTNSIFHVVDLTHPDNDRDRDLERDFGDGVGLTLLCNASQRNAM